jgi:hypothetical protein
VAQDQRSARCLRQRAARLESIEVDEIRDHPHALGRNSVPVDQGVARRRIHRHVAEDARVAHGDIEPLRPAVRHENGGRGRKVEQGRHRFHVMVAVEDVGSPRRGGQVVHHRDSDGAEFLSRLAEKIAVSRNLVSRATERNAEVANVSVRAGTDGEGGVGDQNTHCGLNDAWV